jgi:hypothetical protein
MPIVENDRRRNPDKRLITHVVEIFNGKQGRKVAFGIWGFVAANSLIMADKITADIYWKMFLTCALLIGFGTVLDSVVSKLGDAVSVFAGDKIKTALGKVNDPAPPPTTPPAS